MRHTYPLAEAIQRLQGDVAHYQRRYENSLISSEISEDLAREIIQAIMEIQFSQAMLWAVTAPGGRCDADDVVRKAYPEFYPDEDNNRQARHFYYKVLEPFYEYLQGMVDLIVGGQTTWDILHVRFRQIKLSVPVAVEAFGSSPGRQPPEVRELYGLAYAQAIEAEGGPNAVQSRGLTGVDYVERLGPWLLEVDNEGDYRIMDWTRRHERGEIGLDGSDPSETPWSEINAAAIADQRRNPLTRVTARTFGNAVK